MSLDAAEVTRLLAAAEAETVADARGKAFEAVAEYVFRSLGCPVRRNLVTALGSQQIDLAVAHLGALGPVPTFFLVECKYWEKPVDSAAVGYFLNTCRDRRAALGVVISKHGLTGDKDDATHAHSIALGASFDGVRLIVLTEDDLRKAASDEHLIATLISAWLEAAATGKVGTP